MAADHENGERQAFDRPAMADHPTRRDLLVTSFLLPLAAGVAPAASAATTRFPAGKKLVAYFSRSGNTRVVAGQVSRALQADLFEIEPEQAYPADYFATVEQARQESDRGYEPPLKAEVADVASYGTVFLAFPIWGMTTPPVVRSFLAANDLSGKTIIPLVTHGGYGLGDSLDVVARLAPRSNLVDGFSMEAPQERQTIEKVTQWLGEQRVPK